jgi:c(7)-type cytochrome triheme protein
MLGLTMVLAIGMATAGLTRSLPRLPENFTFPQGQASPGKVTFRHLSHVNQEKPVCTACHPALFKILEKGVPVGSAATIRHSDMQRGQQCGSCHNGKAAFGLFNCPACHRQS